MKMYFDEAREKVEFRWAKADGNGHVIEISVEKHVLKARPEIEAFLSKKGYLKKEGREDKRSEHFVYPEEES